MPRRASMVLARTFRCYRTCRTCHKRGGECWPVISRYTSTPPLHALRSSSAAPNPSRHRTTPEFLDKSVGVHEAAKAFSKALDTLVPKKDKDASS